MNVLGQAVATKEIHGSETVELLPGFWFVRLNHSVKKIVVE
jgi:hypothetical protein